MLTHQGNSLRSRRNVGDDFSILRQPQEGKPKNERPIRRPTPDRTGKSRGGRNDSLILPPTLPPKHPLTRCFLSSVSPSPGFPAASGTVHLTVTKSRRTGTHNVIKDDNVDKSPDAARAARRTASPRVIKDDDCDRSSEAARAAGRAVSQGVNKNSNSDESSGAARTAPREKTGIHAPVTSSDGLADLTSSDRRCDATLNDIIMQCTQQARSL